ncbi:hypothetical protein OFP94_02140 [Brachyspira hyodysenteriae]|nr:hypothetical protein [Brachyspira hyodysenteriae]MCZ9926739.1 hypothetical protein [Brachyspira hyodysenteriae]
MAKLLSIHITYFCIYSITADPFSPLFILVGLPSIYPLTPPAPTIILILEEAPNISLFISTVAADPEPPPKTKFIKRNTKQLQNRQKVALGLYEQERIKAELEEKQKELAKIQIEEEAKAKQMEVEKNYNNEKMRLEYNSQMESWKMSLAQATASIAQAGISALASAMAVPFPANLAAYATLLGIIAAGSVNLATLSQAKPQEPKYLAKGGLVERRNGGINAVIGEGVSDEAVIPLEDRILSKIGSQIFEAAKNNDGIYEVNTQSETSFNQPVYLMLDGKVVAGTMLNLSKRGVKVVSQRGIL